jgi:hypothetical protein
LYLSDILLLTATPFLWHGIQRSLRSRALGILLIFGGLWFANQIVTDLVHGTPPEDFARGWSKIGLFLINLAIIPALIAGSRKRVVLYALGCTAGFLIATQISPDPWFWADHWKFGYSQPFNFALAVIATLFWAHGHEKKAIAILVVCAGTNGFLGARGVAAAAFGAAVLLAVNTRSRATASFTHNLKILTALALALLVGTNAYVAMASNGWLGEAAQTKITAETSGDLGVIVGGRNLLLAGVERVTESPFLGMGSWATGGDYIASAASVLRDHGYNISQTTLQQADPHTLSHSHLIGAWVEAGLFGGFFWTLVLLRMARRLLSGGWRGEPLSPLILFVGCTLLWDILFSPFAQERRFITPYYICCVLAAGELRHRSRLKPNHLIHQQHAPANPVRA